MEAESIVDSVVHLRKLKTKPDSVEKSSIKSSCHSEKLIMNNSNEAKSVKSLANNGFGENSSGKNKLCNKINESLSEKNVL